MTEHTQAHTSDLPGWPCPPRVRDIPSTPESWGWVPVVPHTGAVAQDEVGCLWVDGNAVPQYRHPEESNASPGALVWWTGPGEGLGLWVHPKSLGFLRSISRLDEPDRWVPVMMVLPDPPKV